MSQSIMAEIANRYRQNQDNLLELVGGLTDEQFAWTPNDNRHLGMVECLVGLQHMAGSADA